MIRNHRILGHHSVKELSLLLHAVHRPVYWRILQKPSSTLVLKIHKKSAKQRKGAELYHGKTRVEEQTKFESERTDAQKPGQNTRNLD